MKKIIGAGLAIAMACFLFVACQKSTVEPAEKTPFLSSSANRAAVAKSLKTYFGQTTVAARTTGAEFVVPFFSSESQGIASFNPAAGTLTFASFTAEFGRGDFYRKNPDGTYSVHISSNKAMADYSVLDLNTFNTLEFLYGSPAQLTADYTGNLVEFPFYDDQGNLIFTFRFIDTDQSRSAVSVHGSGWVGPDGAAPNKRLAMKAIITPSGEFQFELTLK